MTTTGSSKGADGRPIVVATDGSQGAREAIEVAIGIALHDRSKVVFVTVSDASEAPDAVEQALAEAADLATTTGVTCSVVRRAGDPIEEIVALATEQDASVVVVGSRGASPVGTAPLGSVSRGVMRRCPRPVLVVRRARARPA